MSSFQPDPPTPPNVGGPLGVLLKWLDAFLTVIDNVYLRLKSFVTRKGRKNKAVRSNSKRSSAQPMLEKPHTQSAYGRSRVSSESRQPASPTSPTSPTSPVVVSAVSEQTYVPSSENRYAAAMRDPAPRGGSPQPAQVLRQRTAIGSAPPARTYVQQEGQLDNGPARTDSPWKPAGPYRRHSQHSSTSSGERKRLSGHSFVPRASLEQPNGTKPRPEPLVAPQAGAMSASTSYNDFSRPASRGDHRDVSPTTTGISGKQYVAVTTGRTGTRYAHVGGATSPSATSFRVSGEHARPRLSGEHARPRLSGERPRQSVEQPRPASGDYSAEEGYGTYNQRASHGSQLSRSTFGPSAPTSPTSATFNHARQPSSRTSPTYLAPAAGKGFDPRRAYAPPEPDTDSDFSDESLYEVENPTAGGSNAQNFAKAYEDNLARRAVSTKSRGSVKAASHHYHQRN